MHLQSVRIAASIFRQLDTKIEGTIRAWNLRVANVRRRTSPVQIGQFAKSPRLHRPTLAPYTPGSERSMAGDTSRQISIN